MQRRNITLLLVLLLSGFYFGCDSYLDGFNNDIDLMKGNISQYGLLAEYLFDGSVDDTSGIGNNGVIAGDTSITGTDRFGTANSTAVFDGDSDLVTFINGNDGLFLSSSSTYSISLWFNANSSGGYIQNLFGRGFIYFRDKDSGYTYDRSIKFSDSENGKLAIRDNPNTTGLQNVECSNTIVSFGEWYHIVVVFKNNVALVYLNNIYEKTVAVGSNPLYLYYIGNSQRYWYGMIDDVRIYNRALSEYEINVLFSEGGWTGN